MPFQKMMIRVWLIGRGRSSLIVAFLLAVLGIKAAGCDMLQIIYPSTNMILKEGDPLTLNCTVTYQQSSDLKAYWCKWVENQSSCARVGNELEALPLTGSPNSQLKVDLSLQIHNVSHSDSGGYQCRASASNQTAMGHYLRVKVIAEHALNTTGSPEAMSQGNRAMRMDSWLKKTRVLILFLWLTLS